MSTQALGRMRIRVSPMDGIRISQNDATSRASAGGGATSEYQLSAWKCSMSVFFNTGGSACPKLYAVLNGEAFNAFLWFPYVPCVPRAPGHHRRGGIGPLLSADCGAGDEHDRRDRQGRWCRRTRSTAGEPCRDC